MEEKKNNNTWTTWVAWGIIIFVVLKLFGVGSAKDEKKTETSSSEPKTEQTTKASEEKKKETEASSQEPQNDGPEYTDASNTEFATYLTTEINNKLGGTYQVTTQPVGNNVLYLYVPQEVKYYEKNEIQELVDSLYSFKENSFSNWAIDKGFDLGFTNSPGLYVKTPDETTVAEESGIINKSMKVKID